MKSFKVFPLVFILFLLGCVKQPIHSNTKSLNPPTLDSQIGLLTEQIVASLSGAGNQKIAIIEFSNLDGQVTRFGQFLAEELITRLYSTGKFEVIERQLLKKVLNEHKLTFSGLIDASSAQAVGKILGIDAIASGTVTDLGPSVKVNARLISTETGKIFAVASVDIIKDAVVSKLMEPASALADTETRQKSQPVPTEKAFPEITAEIDAYLFKVTGCRSSSGLVVCNIQVTNNAPNDRDLTIWFLPTKAWDNNGKNYYLHQLVFADQRFRVRTADGWSGSSRNGGKLISGVPVKLEIVLGELRTPIDKLSLLEIACGSFTVKLRDIPVQQ